MLVKWGERPSPAQYLTLKVLALLNVLYRDQQQFGAAETATKEYGNHGAVALAPQSTFVECAQQGSSLFGSQPVAEPDAEATHALDPPNPSGQFRAEESGVSRFVGDPADGSQTQVDGCRTLALA